MLVWILDERIVLMVETSPIVILLINKVVCASCYNNNRKKNRILPGSRRGM